MTAEDEPTHRPAARIVCLDAAQRVLLLHWRDPGDGTWLWEPPGGGIDPGETPFDTARRELTEETGLDPAAVLDRHVVVERDMYWNRQHKVGPEQFFLARLDGDRPPLGQTALLPDEVGSLHGHAWLDPAGLDALEGRLEPPELRAVIAALTGPDGPGPWSGFSAAI
ncbi:NUDIX hydrolase [Dactylosporangium sp. NPDC051541]|uniref:NUDIX hydrolase n=1 Tax=Dactylosporangium sp. NPDC051541 TaxID=3363977 RepID=UPI0037932941